jgi:hypothetical protein
MLLKRSILHKLPLASALSPRPGRSCAVVRPLGTSGTGDSVAAELAGTGGLVEICRPWPTWALFASAIFGTEPEREISNSCFILETSD